MARLSVFTCPLCESPLHEDEFDDHLFFCVWLELLRTWHTQVVVRRALGEELQANAPVEERIVTARTGTWFD